MEEFDRLVLELKFEKNLNIGEGSEIFLKRKLEIRINLNIEYSAVPAQKGLKLMYFVYLVVIYIFTEQFLNWNSTSREIGKKPWDISNTLRFESCTMPHYLCLSWNDKKCCNQSEMSIL